MSNQQSGGQQFESVAPQSDIQWIKPKDDLAAGDTIEGVFVEVIETNGTYGKNQSFKILTTDRQLLGVSGGELKKRLGAIEPPAYVLLTFDGFEEKEITENKGTENEEKKNVEVAQWTVQKATPPFAPEVAALIAESASYKNKPREQAAAPAAGGRRF